MTDEKKVYIHWLVNLLVLSIIALISWNVNRVQGAVDVQGIAIQKLNQESVRWAIMAEDVKEIKSDLKILLRKP